MIKANDWFARQGWYLDADTERCLAVLTEGLGSPWNWPTMVGTTDGVLVNGERPTRHREGCGHVSVLCRRALATFDDQGLTGLVIAAHVAHVRVFINPWVATDDPRAVHVAEHLRAEYDLDLDPTDEADLTSIASGLFEVVCSPRQPTGDLYTRHPGVLDLVELAAATHRRVTTP